MSWFYPSSKKRLIATIEDYSRSLMSPKPADPEQAIACHLAKLVLYKDPEARFRSIQTVAQLDAQAALAPALKEIVEVSRKWPNSKETKLTSLLASELQKICNSQPGIW